jgi:hypothetical protein
MRISRLDYQSVQADSNGMDGVTYDPAQWTVCPFPCDTHGNVAGWFMFFSTRAVSACRFAVRRRLGYCCHPVAMRYVVPAKGMAEVRL